MNFLLPFGIAALLTFAITPAVMYFAARFHLVDDPKTRFHPAHTHEGIVPRAGGVSIYLGVLGASLLLVPKTPLFIGILAGALILIVIGVLDDRRDVNPYVRLFTNAIATLIVVAAGAGIAYVTNPITGGVIHLDTWRIAVNLFGVHTVVVWADVFAFLWIMWTMNIVGWSAGVDGQMPGFVSIAALVLGMLSLRFTREDPSQLAVTMVAFIVAGLLVYAASLIIGLAVFIIGVTLVSGYETERDVRMDVGDVLREGGYEFRFNGVTEVEGPNYVAAKGRVTVSKDGKQVAELFPEKRQYYTSGMPMTEAAINTGLLGDLYISLGEPIPNSNGAWAVRVYIKPFVDWIWAGTLLMGLGGVLAVSDRRYRMRRRTKSNTLAAEGK